MTNTDSKNILLSVIGVAILLVAVVGISYAIFVFAKKGDTLNTISTGKISMLYTESDNAISINNAIPMSDSVGKIQNEYFDFTAAAEIKGKTSISYEVRAVRTDINEANRLPDEAVNLYLEKKDSSKYISVMEPTVFKKTQNSTLDNVYVNKDSMILYKGLISSDNEASVEENFRLRIWLNDKQKLDDTQKIYKLRVDIYSSLNNK